MADISKITLPSGTTYNLKDAQARADIEGITAAISSGVSFIGNTTTALTDGATTNPITIGGNSVTAIKGSLVTYGDSEFLWDGTKWIFFGDFGSLGALAFKDAASGSYTPAGSVSQPTFTGTSKSVSVKGTPSGTIAIGTGDGTANYTPEGTVSKPTFTGTQGSVSVSGKPTGNVTITSSNSGTKNYTPGGTVTISTGTGTANYTPSGTVSQPSFTGTQGSVSVSGKPTGTVTIGTGTGTANYTPAGTISVTPTVTVNTTTVNSITDVGSLPSCTLPTWTGTVANENLTIGWTEGSFSAGTLPTKGSNKTVATGIKSATATGSFTGTGTQLTASFSGNSLTSTGNFTPSGSVSTPSFTGDGTQLKASWSGTAVNLLQALPVRTSLQQVISHLLEQFHSLHLLVLE